MTFNCVGIFCEDIREEVGGTHTIVGVMPDNISVAGPPNKEAGSSLLFPKREEMLMNREDSSDRSDRLSFVPSATPQTFASAHLVPQNPSVSSAGSDAAARRFL